MFIVEPPLRCGLVELVTLNLALLGSQPKHYADPSSISFFSLFHLFLFIFYFGILNMFLFLFECVLISSFVVKHEESTCRKKK